MIMRNHKTNIATLIQKKSFTRPAACSAVAISPISRAGLTLAAKTHAAMPSGQNRIIDVIAIGQRGDTTATDEGALDVGGCHVGVPVLCGSYEAPPGFQFSDIVFLLSLGPYCGIPEC
jgi:hypothetical protein